jgi:hypothetical protein
VLGFAAAASLAWPVSAPADEPTRYGRALAQASAAAIAPVVGGLPVPVLFGAAAADISATRARARAIDVDAGVLGVVATTETCGQVFVQPDQLPQPVRAASPDGPAEASRDRGALPGEVLAATFAHLAARAAPEPSSHATAEGARLSFGGALTASGGRVSTRSAGIGPATREAVATVDYDDIVIGPVHLEGVHTEAFHRSGAEHGVGTRFRVGALVLNGQRVEPPPDASPAAVLGPANQALSALGITIEPPREEVVGSTIYLRPMEVRFGRSALSSPLVAPLLGALQPLRDQVAAVLAGACGTSAVFTFADLVTGVASGAGSLALQFGAVEASSGEVEVTDPFGAVPPIAGAPLPGASVEGDSLSAGIPSVVGSPGSPGDLRTIKVPGSSSGASSSLEARTGRALLAMLLALPVLALFAGRDWWVMRTNSRSLMEQP